MLRALFLVAILVGAAQADEDPTVQARQLFDSGRRHFDLAEYDAALADFKEAYRTKDDPVFLYNIALCHRLLGQKAEALRLFKNYLQRRPDAPNREDIERRIAALDDEIASEARARASAESERMAAQQSEAFEKSAAAAVRPAEKPPLYKRWWLWTAVGGVVVVGLAVGLGVGLGEGASGSGRYTFPKVQY